MPLAPAIVLCGPSGVGKSTVIRHASDLITDLWLSVSATTRPPRPGEEDGKDYWFVDRERFVAMRDSGDLLEWAEYDGHLRGTPREPLEVKRAAGIPCVLDVDVTGAQQLRATLRDVHFVFLAPPSFEALANRLTARQTDSPGSVAWRLQRAQDELRVIDEFDDVIVNVDARQSAVALVERFRSPRPSE